MAEDGGWKFEVLVSDNGRVIRLLLEVGRGGEEKIERELTRGRDLEEQDFLGLRMWALRSEISDPR